MDTGSEGLSRDRESSLVLGRLGEQQWEEVLEGHLPGVARTLHSAWHIESYQSIVSPALGGSGLPITEGIQAQCPWETCHGQRAWPPTCCATRAWVLALRQLWAAAVLLPAQVSPLSA